MNISRPKLRSEKFDDDDDDDDDDNNNNNEHLPKSVETSQAGKVTVLWNQQYKLTELSATTTNWTL